jgi:hypothetical protein
MSAVQCHYCREPNHTNAACPKLPINNVIPAYKSATKTGFTEKLTEEEEQYIRDNDAYFEDMQRDREDCARWQKEEDERESKRAKMTRKERILDEHKQNEEEEEEWAKHVQRDLSSRYYTNCFRKK